MLAAAQRDAAYGSSEFANELEANSFGDPLNVSARHRKWSLESSVLRGGAGPQGGQETERPVAQEFAAAPAT